MGQRVWSLVEARSARASHGQEVTGLVDGLLWSPPLLGNDRNAPGDRGLARRRVGPVGLTRFCSVALERLVLGMGFIP